MLCSPRRPSQHDADLLFSGMMPTGRSANIPDCFSALSGTRLLACLIVAPQRGYDEPGILSYAISSFCPTSADGLHHQLGPRTSGCMSYRCPSKPGPYWNASSGGVILCLALVLGASPIG